MVKTAAEIWNDGPVTQPYEPYKPDIREWGTWVEQIMAGIIANGSHGLYLTRASLFADLAHPANYSAWVFGDPTVAYNGLYMKVGASGTGSWTRVGDLPYSFIIAYDNGSGTPNAIQATTSIPVTESALVWFSVFEPNDGSPVTVSFNGGPLLTIKTNSGNDIAPGGLQGIVMGVKSGNTFRLISDQASAAILAQIEALVDDAQAAANIAIGAMTTVIDPQFSTRALAQAFSPAVAPAFIRTAGYYAAGDGGGALHKKVNSQPSHAGKFSITLSGGGGVVWYEIAERILTERMFGVRCDGDWAGGGTDDTARLQDWASCPVSNVKRFTGVSKGMETISFPPDTDLQGAGESTGIDFSAAASLSAFTCILFDNSANLVQIAGLASNVVKGPVQFSLTDASTITDGDYICIYNPTDYSWMAGNVAGARNTYRAGEWCRVQSKSGNQLTVMGPLWSAYLSSSVNVYRLRGAGPRVENFRVKPPYLEVSGIKIDCGINTRVVKVRADGSEYAGIVLQRCLDSYVDCNAFQMVDTGTPGNEYGVIFVSCMGGEIHGNYYAQRHGIAFGNSDFACCVPNRSIVVFANTYNSLGIGSLDFGHGCNENLSAVGGTHLGVAIGGKNHRFVGCRIRKGASAGADAPGMVVNGSEFAGGTFRFDNCEFEELVNAGAVANANAQINIVPQASPVEPLRFVFNNCQHLVDNANLYMIRIQAASCPVGISVEVENPTIRGGSAMTQLIRLQNVSGAFSVPVLSVRGVKGVGAAVPRVVTIGTVTISEAHMDPQYGTQAVTPVSTAVTSQTQAVTYGWAYPVGVVPKIKSQQFNAAIGGKRCISINTAIDNAGFNVIAQTCDITNFATTAAGTIQWEATVD